ncbi:MAG: dicarboxylate/amino acid:cation symporter [Brevundimonas sp.]|uniref:dicarboxylate/amino acid:cation symporter n=1 Tax=Brevundimonas sp. TaxID=1871086 RepID=UPI004033C02D
MALSRLRTALTSLSALVLFALIAGLVVGGLAAGGSAEPHGPWIPVLSVLEKLGQTWLNALRITVIPLIFALLVTGVAAIADAASTGRLAARALMVFGVLIVFATVYAILAGLGLLNLWPIDPVAGRALLTALPADQVATVSEAARTDGFSAFLNSLMPNNIVRAAAEDGVLAVVVFALAFGFAATRLQPETRRPLVALFGATAEAMIVMVHWVLLAAPFGVFALALGVGLHGGFSAAGALGHYIAIVCLSQIGLILLTLLIAVVWGRIGLGRFLAASGPALAVAVSTQSSIASLPVMIERARDALGVPQARAGLVLPLAVAVFRMTSPVANLAVCLYVAQLHGVELGLPVLIAGGLTAIAVSIASVGLPGQVSFFASVGPICLAMGVPVGVLPLLLAVEVIPDIFRTLGNVTADMAAVRIVDAAEGETEPAPQ